MNGTPYSQGQNFRLQNGGASELVSSSAVTQGQNTAAATGNTAGQNAADAAAAGGGSSVPTGGVASGDSASIGCAPDIPCPLPTAQGPAVVYDLTQGTSAEDVLKAVETGAAVFGQIPVIGEPIDLFVGGGASLLLGDYEGAGLSALSAIPGPLGNAAGITKLARKAAKVTDAVHGNSKLSEKAQHGYEVFTKSDRSNVVATGVSGGPVTKTGKSQRANRRLSEMNKSDPGVYDAEIVKTLPGGPGARQNILDWEIENANKHRDTLLDKWHKKP